MEEQPSSEPQKSADRRPIGYDEYGKPVFSGPKTPNSNPQTAPQFVHLSRAVEPVKQSLSPEHQAKHDESVKRYPQLNLSSEEFVISAVRRHPIGLVPAVLLTFFFVVVIISTLINLPLIAETAGFNDVNLGPLYLTGVLLVILTLVFGYIAVWVYRNNTFYLTNESVIQEIQKSLFSRLEQTVSLVNIEDASFTQQGLLQNLFNYGSIRLSTEGDETTYRFTYVADPKQEIATLNNAVEAFKNGRPVIND